jgi:hypothetical protein
LTSASGDHLVKIWDIENGDEAKITLKGHNDTIQSLAWNAVGTTLATVSVYSVSPLETCSQRAVIPFLAFAWHCRHKPTIGAGTRLIPPYTLCPSAIIVALMNPDSISADMQTCRDKKLRLFDPRAGVDPVRVVDGHAGVKGSRVIWLGDRDRIATTGVS